MKVGFIGTGNMGGALAHAAAQSPAPAELLLSNRTPEKAQALAQQLGATVSDNETIAQTCDYIFLGVKPQMMADLLARLAAHPVPAAGGLRAGVHGRRPDSPALEGDGGPLLPHPADHAQHCLRRGSGPDAVRPLPGGDGGAAVRLSDPDVRLRTAGAAGGAPSSTPAAPWPACGGAFVSLFLEALADGAVTCGLPRDKARRYAAQMVLGTAQLALQSGQHTAAMKDAVCSPGGTTIAGVRALERGGFRSAAMEAVIAAYEKTLALKS